MAVAVRRRPASERPAQVPDMTWSHLYGTTVALWFRRYLTSGWGHHETRSTRYVRGHICRVAGLRRQGIRLSAGAGSTGPAQRTADERRSRATAPAGPRSGNRAPEG